ncbi:cell division protein FtsK [Taibaiella sp. KBW10]|uniref:FtsK/SpoIIIE family DNA translocase n=1 Tax=Taibaiella sp. KBW10 TaxID=2153357 RepID=UPI000F592FFA|nr:DNA translocase FtsK [Taibaiella sp. KBW10]RQO30836.1 cell division protein FtsK [Taibaiella sp. KBW10]
MPKEAAKKEIKPTKSTHTAAPPTDPAVIAQRKKNIRLGIGFFVTLVGCLWTLSIISYCFNWRHDQNNLISNMSLWDFLFQDKSPVHNWGGRLGAAMSHLLVFRSVGIMSLIFTLWIIAKGVNILYGTKYINTSKWIRWMALAFLFVSPLLSFLFLDQPFPFGGALGNGVVQWTEGFAGKMGTIFVLITVFLIFAFIVFNFDIKPWLRKAKSLAKDTVSDPKKDTDMLMDDGHQEAAEKEADAEYKFTTVYPDETDLPQLEQENRLLSEEGMPNKIANPEPEADLGLTLVEINEEKTPELELNIPDHMIIAPVSKAPDTVSIPTNGALAMELPAEEDLFEPEIYAETTLEEDTEDTAFESFESEEIEDDFVVNKPVSEEKIVPANGGHVSIESGEPYDPSLDLPNYKYPTLDLLELFSQGDIAFDREELERNKNQIIATLRSFGIEIQKISATVGPTVTLYEIIPAEGVRISKIRNLEDDIALSLAALGIRMIAPIPGKGTIGIEVPNANKQMVSMRALLESEKFVNNKMSLPIALGKKIDNENYIVDLATMPHLLMAGATGQGKSVGINAILVSLLYKKHPSQLKFVMVDPKKVELSIYRLIEKHFLAKLPNEEEAILTDTKKVINTLNALCIEMDNRYELLKDAGTRNIKEYNEKFIKRRLNPNDGHKFLPFIVLVIDEFADLIMTAGKEVEMPIARLAQLARAIGIHIIVATQRPSVNVITGIIKANFPARIAFRVSSKIDSRTILDTGGADQLIGRGDMLISHGSELIRLQCAFVDTPEVERIVEFIGNQRGYPSAFELPEYEGAENEGMEEKNIDLSKRDKMFEECAHMVVHSQSGSTSMLQRKFNLGYNRAGRIMDQLEAAGIVGSTQGSKPRDVLVKTEYELQEVLQSFL